MAKKKLEKSNDEDLNKVIELKKVGDHQGSE